MIELRWLARDVETGKEGNISWAYAAPKVLQYRYEVGPKGEQWWGEWKDVPVVYEEIK